MSLLREEDRQEIRKLFQDLVNPVKLVAFKSDKGCDYCPDTIMLLDELTQLDDRLSLEVYDLSDEKASEYKIDKVPAIAIVGDKDYGIRFFGIPAGYEFAALLGDIIDVSKRDSGLAAPLREQLKKINIPVHIQVFVTPTCPYCPTAVRTAHKIAIESDMVRADMVEAQEFPDLANQYNVYAVPKIVINDKVEFEGAYAEPVFVQQVLRVLE